MLFNTFMNYLSWRMVFEFGYGGYERLKLSGGFGVGYKKYYSKKYGNPVSVFYPIDKDYEKRKSGVKYKL